MNDGPLDLSPLDPERDADRADRVVGAALRRIGAERSARKARGWRRTALAAALATTFVLGIGLGYTARGPQAPRDAPLPAGDSVGLASVFEDLEVSDEQRGRIRAVLEMRDPAADELFVAVARELQRIVASRDADIRELLEPQQRAAYERTIAERPVVGFRREYRMENARVRLEAVYGEDLHAD